MPAHFVPMSFLAIKEGSILTGTSVRSQRGEATKSCSQGCSGVNNSMATALSSRDTAVTEHFRFHFWVAEMHLNHKIHRFEMFHNHSASQWCLHRIWDTFGIIQVPCKHRSQILTSNMTVQIH